MRICKHCGKVLIDTPYGYMHTAATLGDCPLDKPDLYAEPDPYAFINMEEE